MVSKASPCKMPGCGKSKAISPSTGHANGSFCGFHSTEYHRLRTRLERADGNRIHYSTDQFIADYQRVEEEQQAMKNRSVPGLTQAIEAWNAADIPVTEEAQSLLLDILGGLVERDTPKNPRRHILNSLLSKNYLQVTSGGAFQITTKGRQYLTACGYALGEATYEDAAPLLPSPKLETDERLPVSEPPPPTPIEDVPSSSAPVQAAPPPPPPEPAPLVVDVRAPGLTLRAEIDVQQLRCWGNDILYRQFRALADLAIAMRDSYGEQKGQ